jgi:hypothetical protein
METGTLKACYGKGWPRDGAKGDTPVDGGWSNQIVWLFTEISDMPWWSSGWGETFGDTIHPVQSPAPSLVFAFGLFYKISNLCSWEQALVGWSQTYTSGRNYCACYVYCQQTPLAAAHRSEETMVRNNITWRRWTRCLKRNESITWRWWIHYLKRNEMRGDSPVTAHPTRDEMSGVFREGDRGANHHRWEIRD